MVCKEIQRYAFVLEELPYPRDRSGVSLYDYEMIINAPKNAMIDIYVMYGEEDTLAVDKLKLESNAINNIVFLKNKRTRYKAILLLCFKSLLGLLSLGNLYKRFSSARFLLKDIYQAVYVSPILSSVGVNPGLPLFVNAVDSFSRYNYRAYQQKKTFSCLCKFYLYKYYERFVFSVADKISFVSSDDLAFVKAISKKNHNKLLNCPIGINHNFFLKSKIKQIDNTLLFLGNFDYEPNVDAAIYLVNSIFSELKKNNPHLVLYIVGKNPPKVILNIKDVICTGYVDDVRKYYWSCSIFVCPLRLGAGTKNKVLEAMASNIPVISSAVGTEGISKITSGIHYLEANSQKEFVESITLLLGNKNKVEKIVSSADELINKSFVWESIAADLFKEMNSIKK